MGSGWGDRRADNQAELGIGGCPSPLSFMPGLFLCGVRDPHPASLAFGDTQRAMRSSPHNSIISMSLSLFLGLLLAPKAAEGAAAAECRKSHISSQKASEQMHEMQETLNSFPGLLAPFPRLLAPLSGISVSRAGARTRSGRGLKAKLRVFRAPSPRVILLNGQGAFPRLLPPR